MPYRNSLPTPQPPATLVQGIAAAWPQQPNGFLRLPQIIGDPDATPPIPALLPVCATTWWAGIKAGRYPKGIKLSPRVTVWRASDVYDLINPSK